MMYGVVFEQADDGGIGAYLPDMPGVGVVAATRSEAAEMIGRAVQFHIAGMIEDGTPLPDPSRTQTYDFFIVIDRTYIRRIDDAALPYIVTESNSAPFWIQSRKFSFQCLCRGGTQNRVKAWITLADYAQVHVGKLFLVGGGINLTGPGPVTMGVAAEILIPWDQRSRKRRLIVDLYDGDGGPSMVPTPFGQAPLEVQAEFEIVPAPGTPAGSELPFEFAFNVVNLPLIAGQTYEWRLRIEGEAEARAVKSFAVRASQGAHAQPLS